jgi:hypothetical protein
MMRNIEKRNGKKKTLSPAGNQTPAVQPVALSYVRKEVNGMKPVKNDMLPINRMKLG